MERNRTGVRSMARTEISDILGRAPWAREREPTIRDAHRETIFFNPRLNAIPRDGFFMKEIPKNRKRNWSILHWWRVRKYVKNYLREYTIRKCREKLIEGIDHYLAYGDSSEPPAYQGYGVLEPIWDSLLQYMNVMQRLREYTFTHTPNNYNLEGVHEVREHLKDEIAEGLGISREVLDQVLDLEENLIPARLAEITGRERERTERIHSINDTPYNYISGGWGWASTSTTVPPGTVVTYDGAPIQRVVLEGGYTPIIGDVFWQREKNTPLTRDVIDISKIFNPYFTGFVLNEYLTVRLEGKDTNIYVSGKMFKQCKYLLLNLEVGKSYKEIESIDDAANKLDRSMEYEHDYDKIPPETEFWGHCSNLQAWVENDYDLRIIHTNLGFPLVRELIKHGDEKAKIVFKEELMYRIEKGRYNAYKMYEADINKYFTKEEREHIYTLLYPPKEEFIKKLEEMDIDTYKNFIEKWDYIQIRKGYIATEVFAGGMGADNNVSVRGDYISTINTGIDHFVDYFGHAITPITIISSRYVRRHAREPPHVYENAEKETEIFELDIILNMPEIGEWVISEDVPDYIIILRDAEGNEVRTGILTLV